MIGEFISKYYIDPIIQGQPYTLVDTLTYAALLIIAVFFVYLWLRRTGITIDHDFALALIPFMVLGGLLRVVEDTGMIPSPYHVLMVTPIIFFVIFAYAVASLVIARYLEARGVILQYSRGFAAAGIGACVLVGFILLLFGLGIIPVAGYAPTIDIGVLVIILAMAFSTSLLVWAALRYLAGWAYVSDILYKLLIFGHLLDASATSFGIDLHPVPYVEQHVVGGALIEATGTAFSMFPLKLAVIIPAIYVLELYRKEGNPELWHLILLAMIMVGMAPGIRGMVRMVLHV
ncbi:MAG: DUF63 family protein [Methanomicrobiaceae archaeon]|nr:DUF63 family protein [Methanomicrobiaceae archaeon]